MLNVITIHGRLTANPELRLTEGGISVCRFSVAVDRSYQKQGTEKATDFFNVVCWRGLAETVSRYFNKGKEIVVSGEMHSERYVDTDGKNRTKYEIQAYSVDFCGSKSDNLPKVTGTNINETLNRPTDFRDISEDDVPF